MANKLKYLILGDHSENRVLIALRVAQKIADRAEKEIDFYRNGIHDLEQNVDIMRPYWLGFDKIMALDKHIQSKLLTYYEVEENKVVCLNVSENQEREDRELIETLEERLRNLI